MFGVKNEILDQLMSIEEASQLWNLEKSFIRQLCMDGRVIARRIDNTWVLLRNQDTPQLDILTPIDPQLLQEVKKLINSYPDKVFSCFITVPEDILDSPVSTLPKLSNHFSSTNTSRTINSITQSIKKHRRNISTYNDPVTIRELMSKKVEVVQRYRSMGEKAFEYLLIMLLKVGQFEPHIKDNKHVYSVSSLSKIVRGGKIVMIKRLLEDGKIEGAYKTKEGEWRIPKSIMKGLTNS
ncbi:hypothetical protein [Ammoniphilus sp. CFH 90114]|uniref:hypothetical protein n=1 Tax=Ammoniphilus sp. CFH 90114 TaxID=2493665 RepID=UPI00100E0979|nr:hypothetical protein [Ammoniphilus sp. CFH 90114]RXT08858.1 hypothetical protein EIZ39_08640 [Ammoniphilus sp. CFH 90114]